MLWLLGFFFESVADWQLDRFIKDPATGEVMDRGLWRYSGSQLLRRVTMWWAFISWHVGPGVDVHHRTLTITYIILFVSGVPMTERFMEGNPVFADYKRRTSVFILGFPKRIKNSVALIHGSSLFNGSVTHGKIISARSAGYLNA